MNLNIDKVPTGGDIRDGEEARAINEIIDYLQALRFVCVDSQLMAIAADGNTVTFDFTGLKNIFRNNHGFGDLG